MTRISKTGNIDALHNVGRTSSKSVNKSQQSRSKKPSQLDISQLEKKVRLLVEKNDLPPEQLKDSIIKEIIKWQFGETALMNNQFNQAYDKLKKMTEDSPAYQKILDDFMDDSK